MTERDFEILTLASAHNAQKATSTDYVAAQLAAFQISRALAAFFETCDVLLCPTLCSPPLRIGELNTMAQDLSHIVPILRRYMPATSMFNMSGQPAMSVPLAWNKAGLPLGMMFSARFGDEAALLRLAAQLEHGTPVEGQIAADLRLNRQNSALFGSEGWNPGLGNRVAFAVCCINFGDRHFDSKRPDR